ncbi:hypothetical protein BO70DRAFT_322737 [Aspergillus heteromorphus CBS 117.55]|uniref:Cytochrome oxidase c assembly-domain-containing protein n=1 Tax=Aspergillus heteromorphus CBS 117.55 TaxID=1448321 RepID=A0A317V965_9EURO|nr:uncharacterized protein BO70DRAFT_322737 [Aspergillus heteromorphus CBS 117.55]PWY69578.1 hypothetical protein BO70DRAFT_322737 [Aspergillus heteromorphus CBS 117.55]
MSRSAADATRFTATGPYAHSKPGSAAPYKLPDFMAKSGSKGQAGPSAPTTPKEKVERLRAQARAARIAQSTSRVDQMVDFGRRFANKAHKTMVYSLIAASGVCGVLTIYSVFSLTMYNRRQRALWVEKELQSLEDAKTAYGRGTATTEQLEMLKNEKIGEIFQRKKDEERAQRPWNKLKRYMFSGMKADETPEAAPNGIPDSIIADTNINTKPGVLEALNAKTAEDAKSAAAAPQGQLDVLAENAETAAKQTTRSWKSWLTGR